MGRLIRSFLGLIAFALFLFWCATGFAQTVPPPPNSVLIGAEGITIQSTTGAGVTFEFGAKGSYHLVPNLPLPALVSCNTAAACAALGGDPLPKTVKSIYAVRQATGYKVNSINAAGVVKTTWVLGMCPLPAMAVGNPKIATTPPLCSAILPASAVATDGQMAGVLNTSAPVFFQYCQGVAAKGSEICDAPFMFSSQPLVVGPTATFGGPVGGTGVGTLYLIQTTFPVTIEVSPGPVKIISVPAATGPGT